MRHEIIIPHCTTPNEYQSRKSDTLYFFLLLGASIFCLGQAKADTTAEKVFGKWERITPERLLVKVPEWERDTSTPGSVTNQYKKPVFLAGGTPKQVPPVNSTSR